MMYLLNIIVQLLFEKIASEVMDRFICIGVNLLHLHTGNGFAITSQLRVYCSPTIGVGH